MEGLIKIGVKTFTRLPNVIICSSRVVSMLGLKTFVCEDKGSVPDAISYLVCNSGQ